MANAPAVLNAYLQFSGSLAQGVLPAQVREQIALTVSQANGCDYCLSAHSAIGKMVGLTGDQIRDSRKGHAADGKVHALLVLAKSLVQNRGHVSDADFQAVKDAGWDDAAIADLRIISITRHKS